MFKNIIIGAVIIMMLATGVSFATGADKEQAAVNAAEKWLALVDAGNYAEGWQSAAGYLKGAVTLEQWEQSLKAVRTPLGATISRTLTTKTYKTTLPGAPDGEYVIIQYETSLQNKKTAVETVSAMLDKDGQWRVAGYFIK